MESYVDFSLKNPSLTHYLSRILKRYPLGGQIIKELIQNAEDSGASVVKFYIDYSEYPKETLLHPELDKFQGPGLLAFNNSIFDDSDFQSIRNIEKSEKYDKPLKIGKFGLGFNSIYHLTDLPTIISRNSIIIFDPHQKYFNEYGCKRGMRIFFNNSESKSELISKYPDQFKPYSNINFSDSDKFDENCKIDFNNEFKGTFFRFPIRNEQAAELSDLSKAYKPLDQMIHEDILESFFKDFNLILLFLRRLERIEFYEIKDNVQTLIASTFIDYSKSSEGLELARKEFMNELKKRVDQKEKTMDKNAFRLDDIINNFKMVIETNILRKETGIMSNKVDKYLISSLVKFRSSSEKLRELAYKTATFPMSSVAYKIGQSSDLKEKFKQSRYFCFLPMPETIELSGLPLHINGSFGLRDDRRDFKWLAEDAKEDETAIWQELIVSEVVSQVLIQIIDYSKRLIDSKDSDLSLEEFYHLLPCLENMSHNWRNKHLKTYLNSLPHADLILTKSKKWCKIKEAYLNNRLVEQIKKYSNENDLDSQEVNFIQSIYKLVDDDNLSLISVPQHLIDIFQLDQEVQLKFIDLQAICTSLRDSQKVAKLDDDEKVNLLNFIIQWCGDKLSDLKDTHVMPLANGGWTRFKNSQNEIIMFTENETETLFSAHLSSIMFDLKRLNKGSRKRVMEWFESNNNLEQLVLYRNDKFIRLFEMSLNELKINQNRTIHSDYMAWLELVWKFITKNFSESLKPFEKFHIIPNKQPEFVFGQYFETFPLKDDTNSKVKYFLLNNSIAKSEIPSKIIEFFKTNAVFRDTVTNKPYGCIIFDELPFDLFKNHDIHQYFKLFNLDSLIESFMLLKECLGNAFQQLLSNKMSHECKQELVNYLNKESPSFTSKTNFIQLIKNEFPLFKFYDKQGESIAANNQQIPEIIIQDGIKINPSIVALDCSSCKSLASVLGFTTWELNQIVDKTFDFYISNNDFTSIHSLVKWIIENMKAISKYEANNVIQNLLLNKRVFSNQKNNVLANLNELYDPLDKYVKIFVDEAKILNNLYQTEPFYSYLKPHLLRPEKIDLTFFDKYMTELETALKSFGSYDEPKQSEILEKIKTIIEFIFEMNNLKNTDSFLKASFKYKWIPSRQSGSIHTFYRSNELYSPANSDLIGRVRPVVDETVVPVGYFNSLKVKTEISPIEVFENYSYMVENVRDIDSKLLEKMYSIISNSKSGTFDIKKSINETFKSKNIPFVFDGIDSYRHPKELILIPSAVIGDLSPYYFVIDEKNAFVNKFRAFYTEKLGIVPELDLNILLDVLDRIREDTTTSDPRKNSLIERIFILLNKEPYINELTGNQTMKSRLWLPVMVGSNLGFEKIENCVYDDTKDDELINENIEICAREGIKICYAEINPKFLIKLGVKSFTDRIMKIEEFEIENFGQNEKLTDRINKLLDGYKDGLSVFKEIIQNADDANANIVKFCYDKRKNIWKNPKKLLDPGMINAQSPALIVYNDSRFTDSDFKNLSQLGSGSKKNEKDKIGKFGLGFNTVYNLTDIPSIVSGNTYVAFDPEIKYLKNRIKDPLNPGIKFSFNESTNQYLNKYSDQFKPYENVFGCNIFEKDFHYDGTLIKLPLRTTPSAISSNVYNNDFEIMRLFEILHKNGDSLLLFTQNVKRIEIYFLNDDDNGMKLLFEVEKSPIEYLNKHQINIDERIQNCIKLNKTDLEYKKQINILKAIEVGLRSSSNLKIETSFLLKTEIKVHKSNLQLISPANEFKENNESKWLIVTSFNSDDLVRNDENFKSFVPCVGMAVEIEKLSNSFHNKKFKLKKKDASKPGTAFCFLPLDIKTSLSYHINGSFLLSEDRLNFYQSSINDKTNNSKHEWNKRLLKPLVNNLIILINHVSKSCYVDDINQMIEYFWPIDNKSAYFIEFEKAFYHEMFKPGQLTFAYIQDALQNKISFKQYDQCMLVDFNFGSKEAQTEAKKVAKKVIEKNDKLELIELPFVYLDKIRSHIKPERLVNDFNLLEKLLAERSFLQVNECYEKLFIYYINEKLFINKELTKYGELIKAGEYILTSGKQFKSLAKLVNPNQDKLHKELIETSDNFFPSDAICNDDRCLFQLSELGLQKNLTSEMIITLAEKVNATAIADLSKSKSLSKTLNEYSYNFYNKLDADLINELKVRLNNISWLYPKEKPYAWSLPWFTETNKSALPTYKPTELIDNKYTFELGCVKPLACSFQTQNPFLTFFSVDTGILMDNSINQLNLLIQYFKSNNNSKNVDSEKNLREFIEKLYSLMNQYLNGSGLLLDQFAKSKRLDELKSKLPTKWIFNPDYEQHMFLGIESFALDVENGIEPELIKFPKLYTKYIDLFKHFGIGDYFTIDILRLKLEKLKNEFLDRPLDADHFKICMKIIQEILYVDKNKKNSNTPTLIQMIKDKTFFLPDENNIMRNLKELTFENPNMFLNSGVNFYVLNSSVPAKSFGIEGLKNKLLSVIGEPFGQKEKLVDRIRDILNRYSAEICIFNELIQNADDANATEIKFVLDKRELKKEKTFGECFNELQGPALCCWNNSTFQNADFEGIIGLGKGSKRDAVEKCGRFGVGFNSVYHLTDAPQFISNFDDYVIFDPLCKYFPDISEPNPGFRIKNIKKNMRGNFFDDVLSGFDFGLNLEGASMFRLPLRSNCNSNISSKTFTTNKLEDLIRLFASRCEETLIFLKSIKKIAFYSLDQTGLNLINEHTAELSKEDQLKRDGYLNNLKIQMSNGSYISNVNQKVSYRANIKTNLNTTTSYLILEQFGFDINKYTAELDKTRKDLCSKTSSKFFPVASLAYKINNSQDNYKLYNCLPLQQQSPLNCNINAYWCLHKENRTNIYEFNQREENVDKETALLSTNWNLNLINKMILPLYINLVELVVQNYKSGLITYESVDQFVEKYLKLFSYGIQDKKEIQPYFKEFYACFYKETHSINCLPYVNSNQKIDWVKPAEVVFSSSLENYFYKNSIKSFNEIFNILVQIDLKILKQSHLIALFKHGNVELKEIKPSDVINAFKINKSQFFGHHLKDTIISNEAILNDILSFCLKIDYSGYSKSINSNDLELQSLVRSLENFPLLPTNDNKLNMFSTASKILIYENPEIFDDKEKQKLFLNKSFYNLFKLFMYDHNMNFFKSYLKYIDINDLKNLLPSVLKIAIASNKNAHSIKLEDCDYKKIEKIWEIIRVAVESVHTNYSSISKRTLINTLTPIKDCYLIPVRFNSTNQVHLFQISKCKMVLFGTSYENTLLNYIIKEIDLPKLDSRFNLNFVLKNISVCFDRNGDILEFLNENKDNKLIFKNENKNAFLSLITNFISTKYTNRGVSYLEFENNPQNPIDQHEIRQIIRFLPIFTDLFNYIDSLENRTVYLLNLNDLPNEVLRMMRTVSFFQEDLIDYCNKANSILIEYYQEYDRLYKYLNLNVIKLDDFYPSYFNYCLGRTEANLKTTFKEHVDVLRILDENNQLNNENMRGLLKTLPFVSKDQKTFYGINQLLDDRNKLFEFFFPESIIPNANQYRTDKWRNFFIKYGLKAKVDVEDCQKIANILSGKQFWLEENYQINLIETEILIKELFRAIINDLNNSERDDKKALNSIKSIKFIPNYYITNQARSSKIQSKIHCLINKEENKLISLENSTTSNNADYYWTVKPVLPSYCNILLDYDYQNLNIYKDINYDCLIDNLIKLIDTLSADDLINKLNKKDIIQITHILAKHFYILQSKLISRNDLINMDKLKNKKCVLNKSITTNKYQFSEFQLFYKGLDRTDAIDGHFHMIPKKFKNYFSLFQNFGAKKKVNGNECISLLNFYLELSNKNSDRKLTFQQYNNVMVIFKMLFYDNLIASSQSFVIHAPSVLKKMDKLDKFYYADKSSHNRLIENSDYIKCMCLFDIKDMMNIIENSMKSTKVSNDSSGEESPPSDNEELIMDEKILVDNDFKEGLNQNDSNFLKRLMLKQLNWNQIFMNMPYFAQYPHLKPRPLSEILVEKLDDSDESIAKAKQFTSRNKKIHSSDFIEAVVKSIYLINDGLDKSDLDGFLTENISKSIKSISVFIKDEIKTYFINIKTNEKIPNSDRSANFARLKVNENELNIIIKNSCKDEFDRNFYVAETIFEKVQDSFLGLNETTVDNYDVLKRTIDLIKEGLSKRPHRFIFLVMKLLDAEQSNYDEMLLEYELKSLNNFK